MSDDTPIDLSQLTREEIDSLARDAKGMWSDHPYIKDSVEWVRALRKSLFKEPLTGFGLRRHIMRLLVCGDRNWTDKEAIICRLQDLLPQVVIEGEARGADSIARDVAYMLGIKVLAYPAKWAEYGRVAGMIRNQQMINDGNPNMVLAFHDHISESKGTADMLRRASRAGIPIEVWSHK